LIALLLAENALTAYLAILQSPFLALTAFLATFLSCFLTTALTFFLLIFTGLLMSFLAAAFFLRVFLTPLALAAFRSFLAAGALALAAFYALGAL